MNSELMSLARAVLREGTNLFPYRPSALKNRYRLLLGTLEAGQRCQTQSVYEGAAELRIRVLFLEDRGEADLCERLLEVGPGILEFDLGRVEVRVETDRVTVAVACGRDRLYAVHVVAEIEGGRFISSIDPPARWAEAVGRCHNHGLWPVLAGPVGAGQAILSSPIILYDYPSLAPESRDDLNDCTETEALLRLSILGLSPAERQEAWESGPASRALIEATEALTAPDFARLHGAVRPSRFGVARGDTVRLQPRHRADILDLALQGRTATVRDLREDLEGKLYVVVSVDDDPGQDLELGHRFYFAPDEVERLRS